jgi:hypothetical protein
LLFSHLLQQVLLLTELLLVLVNKVWSHFFHFFIKFFLQLSHALSNVLNISLVELNLLIFKNVPSVVFIAILLFCYTRLKSHEKIELLRQLLTQLKDIVGPEVNEVEIFVDQSEIYLFFLAEVVIEHQLNLQVLLLENTCIWYWDVSVLAQLHSKEGQFKKRWLYSVVELVK